MRASSLLVVKLYQVYVASRAMNRRTQQGRNACESRLAGQGGSNTLEIDLPDSIHDNVALFNPVSATNLHYGSRPHANAAGYLASLDRFTKLLRELHRERPTLSANVRHQPEPAACQLTNAIGTAPANTPTTISATKPSMLTIAL